MSRAIPAGLTQEHILRALADLDAGITHPFGTPTGDAASLQAAHKAYKESGGSMKTLIAALLTSEAFLYRRAETTNHK